MSSGYNQYDPRLVERISSEAPMFNPAQMQQPRQRFGGNLNIDMQMPAGVEERIRQLQKMRGPVNPPQNFQLFPAPNGLRQVAPDPQPEPEMPLRSVLRRDNMG